MSDISLSQLLEAGVHFDHKAYRWNPKMFPYIYSPLADRYGRKPIAIIGIIIYIVCAGAAYLATSIEYLLIARFC